MFDEISERTLTPSSRARLLLALPVFAVAALVVAQVLALFMLTQSLAGLIVTGFLFGFPVLFVVEVLVIVLRYDDPPSPKFVLVGMLFVVAAITWVVALNVGLRTLPFRT